MKGTVRWFSNSRGYGFISPEDGEDVFVHFSAISMDGYKSLPEGAQVEFEITDGPKGKRATEVKVVGEGAPVESSEAKAEEAATEEPSESEESGEEPAEDSEEDNKEEQ